ncbi:MAG: M55 family metallopeptidase [Chloroflexi bacterium]|nr:M55 family metallopeptidase [Chloroflexota bacterium]
MKILIADDMEGISGVVDWGHVDSKNDEYQRFRRIMTAEVNSAVAGAFAGGADEVVVSDGHGGAKNVMIENLDPRARLNTGAPSEFQMISGIDKGVNGLIFIGYHPRYGTLKGVLAHTWSLGVVNLWLNDRVVGEIGLNSSVAGHFGVPLIMISSDQAGCNEAAAFVPGVETVAVKQGTGTFAAECLPPEVSHELIRETAQKAVKNLIKGISPAPVKTSTPVVVKVELNNAQQADRAMTTPAAVRVDGRTVQVEVPDMVEAYRAFRTIVGLAGPNF